MLLRRLTGSKWSGDLAEIEVNEEMDASQTTKNKTF